MNIDYQPTNSPVKIPLIKPIERIDRLVKSGFSSKTKHPIIKFIDDEDKFNLAIPFVSMFLEEVIGRKKLNQVLLLFSGILGGTVLTNLDKFKPKPKLANKVTQLHQRG